MDIILLLCLISSVGNPRRVGVDGETVGGYAGTSFPRSQTTISAEMYPHLFKGFPFSVFKKLFRLYARAVFSSFLCAEGLRKWNPAL